MLRRVFLALSENPRARAFATQHPVGRRVSRRFVAGETLEDALVAVDRLMAAGFLTSVNFLGEKTTTPEEATAAAAAYQEILRRLGGRPGDCYVSVKLTQLGLDLGVELARSHLRRILEQAKTTGTFIRVDMEHSSYVDATLSILEGCRREGYDRLGGVIQAYLYRSAEDLERLLRLGIPVRLVKGAYAEPATIAYPRKRDVDANYLRLLQRLLRDPEYHAVATHDERLIDAAIAQTRQDQRSPDTFEFQMIYGVRRDVAERLRAAGCRMRIYVPYGSQWYPYFMRRLAERPANIGFVLRNLLRG
ncbi:MAG: proline dehydrogenase family protein [Armatimonadota bacterium]